MTTDHLKNDSDEPVSQREFNTMMHAIHEDHMQMFDRFNRIEGRLDVVEKRLDTIEVRLDTLEDKVEAIGVKIDRLTLAMEDLTIAMKDIPTRVARLEQAA